MKWKKYTIATTTQAEDWVVSLLEDMGIEGIEISNQVPITQAEKEALFIDFLPELGEDDGSSKVSFFLECPAEAEKSVSEEVEMAKWLEEEKALLDKVREGLMELSDWVEVGEGPITSSFTEAEDWIRNWKQYFQAFSIDDIYIHPSWVESPAKEDYGCVIEIDPGTSFGTGKHETTQLCIRQMRNFLTPEAAVLDVGCGSGILSLVASKLGAAVVNGLDIDPICMEAVEENYQRNQLSEKKGCFCQGNLLEDTSPLEQMEPKQYDIIVANILADVIIPLAPIVKAYLKEDGVFISSGIIDFKEEAVKEALLESGYEILEIRHQGEWVGFTARLKK